MIPILILAGLATAGVLALSIKQINEWEVGLKFTLGRLSGRLEPGIRIVLPGVQRFARIDKRIRNRDLPRQVVITRDNVTALIDAVVYFKVVDPTKAILNVENYELAVKDRAKVVLRDVVGEITLDELLANRDEVAARVRAQVEQFVSQWGLHLELIALQDIQLPSNISDAIARKAIAEREKQVVITKSEADLESAKNFAAAAKMLVASPGALELRRLEALQNISASGNTKIVFDLARPGDGREQTLGLAAAMAETKPAVDVRVANETPAGDEIALEIDARERAMNRK
ncbi:MAG: SPFH domain-containing protein [Sandaracinaceae bacterium]|nr:SPFH domain-containing protein [Sandaracinaceae bacterium]